MLTGVAAGVLQLNKAIVFFSVDRNGSLDGPEVLAFLGMIGKSFATLNASDGSTRPVT